MSLFFRPLENQSVTPHVSESSDDVRERPDETLPPASSLLFGCCWAVRLTERCFLSLSFLQWQQLLVRRSPGSLPNYNVRHNFYCFHIDELAI
ncbi:hypothetical protein CDAR_453671 [Caerostris darwini]|uniref:Uncharacterized protein n=1 Tax=Caerostris darwini TaxID=1538125 RepID=A0AAV4P1C2_9ARAC|nr:hypothetical protein CDAR_453671 [Caerostris darwini]